MKNFVAVWMALILSCLIIENTWANVVPPLITEIEAPEKGFAAGNHIPVTLSVIVPNTGNNQEASIKLTLSASGVAKIVGSSKWMINEFKLGEPQKVTTTVLIDGYGQGELHLQAESFAANGDRLWGKADSIFILQTVDRLLSGKSSYFDLRRQKIEADLAKGWLDSSQYQLEMRRLIEGKDLRFERELKGLPLVEPSTQVTAAVVDSTTVSGRATYTHRININAFASAANARAIPSALVEFFDSNGGVETKLATTPAVVLTDNDGNYTATVPGKRADDVAVNLVVKIKTDSPAAIIGPIGIGADAGLVHTFSTTPAAITAATTTVNMLIDNTNLTLLGAFALHEGILVSFNFVVSNNTRTSVGVAPAKIFVEFPGTNSKGSFFSMNGGDHLNIGQDHAHDWDVYTHEYGHYVQKLNGTSQNPGGKHFITGNNTGFIQKTGALPLTKDQGIKLAWGEGWPTFFGTNLQITVGAGAFGIFTAGDMVYADTANTFSYQLEGNNTPWQGTGEDNELSVQRALWDFADKEQDGHDEVQFGNDQMWKQLHSGVKPVTLDQFRAKFDNLTPSSPAGYSTGSLGQNRVKYGRLYFDHNIGPEPTAPSDGYTSSTPPTFRWKTKGAGNAPSYHFNRFNILFYNNDFSKVVFTSPEIPTAKGSVAADGLTAEWTPTAAEWITITDADKVLHWVVAGSHADVVTPTGPYLGLDRTIGGPSIAFVIDDTGSMGEEIDGVRAGLTLFINKLRALSLVVEPLIEVISFKDNVTHRIASKDLDEVQKVVDSLLASGGGDCPESSAEALQEAILNISSLGVILFATDASPHSGYDLAGLKLKALAKGIVVNQIVTGDCEPGGAVSSANATAVKSMLLTDAGNDVPAGSRNPGYTPLPGSDQPVQWWHDVICSDCPASDYTGPTMSPNILKPVGDFTLPTPSAVASFADLAAASPKGHFLYMPGVNAGDSQPFINAVANAALAAVVPTVLATQPIDGYQGAVMDVTINGGNTNFRNDSILSFTGSGITVNSITVLSPTSLVANIAIDVAAATGFRDVTVTTNLGGGTTESAGGTGQFRVVAGTADAKLVSVTPAMVTRDSTVTLTISGLNTHFGTGTIVSFSGTGMITDSVSVTSPTSLQAKVTLAADASLGFHRIQVTTGGEVVALDNTLVAVTKIGVAIGVPAIVSINPKSLPRGATNQVLAVASAHTNFVDGVTTADISGSGVTVVSTTITSTTAAQVTVNVSADAPLGSRDVSLTTGGEVATLIGGIAVMDGASPPAGVAPIPTLQEWMLLLFGLLLGSLIWYQSQRKGQIV